MCLNKNLVIIQKKEECNGKYKGMILIYDPKGILKYSKIKKLDGLNLRGPFIFCRE